MIDLHVHILPGLDDGPERMDDAVRMGRIAVEAGTSIIAATPHMFDGQYNVSAEQVREGVCALQNELDRQGIPLRVLPGGDVHGQVDLADHLRAGEVMTLADAGKYLLVELSSQVVPPHTANMLFALQMSGVTPIITHPERNLEIQRAPDLLLPFLASGNLVQVTAASLTGNFGPDAEHCAKELIIRRMAHLVASDAHLPRGRPPGLRRARSVVEDLLDRDIAATLFDKHPQSILAGQPIDPPIPLATRPRRMRLWGRWKR